MWGRINEANFKSERWLKTGKSQKNKYVNTSTFFFFFSFFFLIFNLLFRMVKDFQCVIANLVTSNISSKKKKHVILDIILLFS
jgi:hypothetical protein